MAKDLGKMTKSELIDLLESQKTKATEKTVSTEDKIASIEKTKVCNSAKAADFSGIVDVVTGLAKKIEDGKKTIADIEEAIRIKENELADLHEVGACLLKLEYINDSIGALNESKKELEQFIRTREAEIRAELNAIEVDGKSRINKSLSEQKDIAEYNHRASMRKLDEELTAKRVKHDAEVKIEKDELDELRITLSESAIEIDEMREIIVKNAETTKLAVNSAIAGVKNELQKDFDNRVKILNLENSGMVSKLEEENKSLKMRIGTMEKEMYGLREENKQAYDRVTQMAIAQSKSQQTVIQGKE